MAYKLPALRFSYDALDPYLDTETLELHHDKHHQAHVDHLNQVLEPFPQFTDLPIEDLLRRLDHVVPETIRTAVRDNGGGRANHEFFWRSLGPNAGGSPKGAIADAISVY